jgi:hypothetical protein
MPMTAAQVTALFFEHVAQMGIPNATVVQLQGEGVSNIDNLVDHFGQRHHRADCC